MIATPALDPELTRQTMEQWQNFWMFPAILAIAILVVFAVTFWDKTEVGSQAEPSED